MKNKYQEALDYLRWIGGDGYYKKQREKSLDVLQELVDKETPMKPYYRQDCPVCKNNIGDNRYCSYCGQKLDRSIEE